MLLDGFNHVAILTSDTKRLHAFYEEVFDTSVPRDGPETPNGAEVRLSVVHVGPHSELNVFEVDGNTEAERQTPMFGRGRIDHLALHAESLEAFETIRDRLMARGASRRFRDRFRSDPERVLPRPGRSRVRGVRAEPGRATGRHQPARHAGGALPRLVLALRLSRGVAPLRGARGSRDPRRRWRSQTRLGSAPTAPMPDSAFHRIHASESASARSSSGRSSCRSAPAIASTALRLTERLASLSEDCPVRGQPYRADASASSAAATWRRAGSGSSHTARTRSRSSGRSARSAPRSAHARSSRRGARVSSSDVTARAGPDSVGRRRAFEGASPANSRVTSRRIGSRSCSQRSGRAIVTATKSGPTSTLRDLVEVVEEPRPRGSVEAAVADS